MTLPYLTYFILSYLVLSCLIFFTFPLCTYFVHMDIDIEMCPLPLLLFLSISQSPSVCSCLSLTGVIPFAVDFMENEFNSTFGAWPEVHLVISADHQLLLKTEAEAGLGSIAGGTWDTQVAACLTRLGASK